LRVMENEDKNLDQVSEPTPRGKSGKSRESRESRKSRRSERPHLMQSERKPGHVVRLDPSLMGFLSSHRRMKEPLSRTIKRLLGFGPAKDASAPREFFILPEARVVCSAVTLAEARGEAVFHRAERERIEEPILVREVAL